MNVRQGHEWDPFEGLASLPAAELEDFLAETCRSLQKRFAPLRTAPRVECPRPPQPIAMQPSMSTQQAFGLHDATKSPARGRVRWRGVSDRLARRDRVHQPWRLGESAAASTGGIDPDLFRAEHIPSSHHWSMSPKGQHFELGIAEMNLFPMLSALGLAHAAFGERLLPIGTLYDPFIERGLDALNYACYQDARFILVATPSGVTLAPEGGAHQSIATPLIGMAQDGLTSFEPAFADELAVILRWGFEHIQAPPRDTTADRFT